MFNQSVIIAHAVTGILIILTGFLILLPFTKNYV